MTEVAKVYGGSLYDLAVEENKQDLLLEQMDGVCALMRQEPEYLRLLATPSLPKAERCGLIDEAFGAQADQYLLNFLKILCENGTLSELFGCAREFRSRYNADNGIAEATAVSAVPLSKEQQTAMREKLAAITGRRIDLQCRVDPAVMGGIRLEMDGVQMDGTVESRLAALRQAIGKASL